MASSAELRELDYEELETRLVEYRRELFNLRFQLATGQLDNTARVGQAKKDVARILTILRDYEIAAAEGRTIEPTPQVVRRPRRRVETAEDQSPVDDAFDEEQDEAPVAEGVDEAAGQLQEEGLVEDDDLVEEEVLEDVDEAESLGSVGEDDEGESEEVADEPVVEEKRPRLRRRRSRAKASGDDEAEAAEAADEEEQ